MLKNESGTLLPLEGLNNNEKRFLNVLIHLLLKEDDTSTKNKDTYSTFLLLKSNKNINIDQNEVISTLSNFIESEIEL